MLKLSGHFLAIPATGTSKGRRRKGGKTRGWKAGIEEKGRREGKKSRKRIRKNSDAEE
jgi:hypothetical protein